MMMRATRGMTLPYHASRKPGTVTYFMLAHRLFAVMGQPGNHDAGDAGHDLTLPSENPAVQPAIDGYNRLK